MKFSDNPGGEQGFLGRGTRLSRSSLSLLVTRKNEYRIGDVYTALAGDTKFRHGILPIRVAVRRKI